METYLEGARKVRENQLIIKDSGPAGPTAHAQSPKYLNKQTYNNAICRAPAVQEEIGRIREAFGCSHVSDL